MIPNVKDRDLKTAGVTATGSFGISLQHSAHLMTILRDTLYSDKILAVIREYSANAWDAHRSVDKGDVPIAVKLPTTLEPTLEIKDFGPGLSQEDMFHVYTQYGASSKRGDDNSVGMLGIGSKSGFAYSDSFTVISRHGGTKGTYVAVLDESDEGVINLLHEEPCGDDTGVTIQIAIRSEDIEEFRRKGQILFQHFRPRPLVNIDLPTVSKGLAPLQHGIIYANDDVESDERGWVAVMGCVPYRINLSQVKGLGEYVSKVSGVIYFNIGDVQINASREELKYSPDTKSAIVAKLEALTEEFVINTIKTIETELLTPWEKKLRAQVFRKLHIPVPKSVREVADGAVRIKDHPLSFCFRKRPVKKSKGGSGSERDDSGVLFVKETVRVLLVDDKRSLHGFQLTENDYLVRPVDPKKWDVVRKDLDAFFAKVGITGVPILPLSSLEWESPRSNSKKNYSNPKHLCRAFRLTTRVSNRKPHSANWESVFREPLPTDVFVIIKGFEATQRRFLEWYREDAKLLRVFGRKMPDVLGYKTTEAKPVRAEDVIGVEYATWRKSMWRPLVTSFVKEMIAKKVWLRPRSIPVFPLLSTGDAGNVIKRLGADHPISSFLRNYLRTKNDFRKMPEGFVEALGTLETAIEDRREVPYADPPEEMLNQLSKMYPLLLSRSFGLSELWGAARNEWIEYVQLKDAKYNQEKRHAGPIHVDERVPDNRVAGKEPHGAEGLSQLRVVEERSAA